MGNFVECAATQIFLGAANFSQLDSWSRSLRHVADFCCCACDALAELLNWSKGNFKCHAARSCHGALCLSVFLLLNIFRILFSYTRWVFPLVELRGAKVNLTTAHRAFWYVIASGLAIGIVGNLITQLL